MFCGSLTMHTAYTNCGWHSVVHLGQDQKAHHAMTLEDQVFESLRGVERLSGWAVKWRCIALNDVSRCWRYELATQLALSVEFPSCNGCSLLSFESLLSRRLFYEDLSNLSKYHLWWDWRISYWQDQRARSTELALQIVQALKRWDETLDPRDWIDRIRPGPTSSSFQAAGLTKQGKQHVDILYINGWW